MHSDEASQGGGWWQGCGAAYPRRLVEVARLRVLVLRPREIDEVEPSLPFDAVGLRADGHVQRKHQMR